LLFLKLKTIMLFRFLKYVQPVWYFNLSSKSTLPLFVDYTKIDSSYKELIKYDSAYSSTEGSLRDAAYQAWHKGIVLFDPSLQLSNSGNLLPVEDEYRFVRKYYNSIWSVYVLVIRLLSFHNPFGEVRSFFKAYNLQRSDLYKNVYNWEDYHSFESELVKREPLVSVIIPTLNRYEFLKDVMLDLESQSHKNFEVIVIDQSEPFQKGFYEGWNLKLQAIHQYEKALWLARNTAIRLAKSEFILLYDDDSRVEPDWIAQHLKCLDFFKVDISAGVSLSVIGAKIPTNYSFIRWADQFDTGNVLIKKDVFRKIGLFDRQFERQRLGDGEFGLRAYLAGCIGISNPYAKRIHLKVAKGGLRQMGSWDGFRPTKITSPRPMPSVIYLSKRYFGKDMAIYDLLIKVPSSVLPFKYKRNTTLLVVGSLLAILVFPFILFQVIKSWKIANGMIKRGPVIDRLPCPDEQYRFV